MSETLLVEIGNTAWKVARYRAGLPIEFLHKGYGIDGLLEFLTEQPMQHVALASVGTEEHIAAIQAHLDAQGKVLHVARSATGFGIQHCYQQPETLGVDRWLTLFVAKASQRAAIIIDAGTAITLDVITANGDHKGGWIAPGMKLMQESLVQRSTRLKVTEQVPNEILGTATERAIFLGCRASLRGFVSAALSAAYGALGVQNNLNSKLPTNAAADSTASAIAVWCTGGDSEYLQVGELSNAEMRPHLVLEGLALWYQQKEAT